MRSLGHDEVDALRRAHGERRVVDAGQVLDLGRPDAARVDHDPGLYVELAPGLGVAHARAGHAIAVAQHVDGAHAGGGDGAVGQGGAYQRHDEARVVHLRVVIADAAAQRAVAQRRHVAQAARLGKVAVARHGRVQAGQGVVDEKPGPHVEAVPAAVLERKEERRGVHQVRSGLLEQQAALVERFAHEHEVEVLEVAQAAVDEFARAARRTRREVALLDQRDAQPAARRI